MQSMESLKRWFSRFEREFYPRALKVLTWTGRNVPFGVRTILGLLLMAGGFLGFLPILGFWMLPLGTMIAALDIAPLRIRMMRWIARRARLAGGGLKQKRAPAGAL